MSEYKGYQVVNPPNVGSLYKIMPIGKGSVPAKLRGMYTNPVEAQRDIDKYNTAKELVKGKGKQDG
jgi:hypothetical protein